MPGRDIIFTNGGVYHIFNRTIDKKRIFETSVFAYTYLQILSYYRSTKVRLSYSRFKRLDKQTKESILKEVSYPTHFKINLLAYCLMPTHFHLLIYQKKESGVQKFMTDTANSITRYYNIISERKGPLFLPRFKAVQVTNNEQLIHVSRYIHLNPYSSKLIVDKNLLYTYKLSSYLHYISNSYKTDLIQCERVMELFNFDGERYKKFVMSHAEHQQTIEQVKYTYKW